MISYVFNMIRAIFRAEIPGRSVEMNKNFGRIIASIFKSKRKGH
jgi:hypothetical protein